MTPEQLQQEIDTYVLKIEQVKQEIHQVVVGQDMLIQSLFIGLLAKGHILLEGVPGLAKTLSVETFSKTLDLSFHRIQFTPDLLPSDLVGTEIFNMKTGEFSTKLGPIVSHCILADEINRAPSKVQSALLEAMAEKQVTIGNTTFPLPDPFIVLATQNPVEQSGTYKLPEAQLDRFLLKTKVGYPEKQQEIEMYKKHTTFEKKKIAPILSKDEILHIQNIISHIYVSESIFEYVMNIVDASRYGNKYNLSHIVPYIHYGISPRGGLALIQAAKVCAFLQKRAFVLPEDIKSIALSVLAHRIVLTYEALSQDITSNFIINTLLETVEVI